MSVKARFWVQSVQKQASAGGGLTYSVALAPVIRGKGQPGYTEDANTDWSKYTPSGGIQLTITAEGAQLWFEDRIGKDVAITFADPEDEGS